MKALLIYLLVLTALTAQDEFSISKATIGGYGELHINSVDEDSKATKTTADFHRFVLFFGYNFNEKWSFKSEVELEHNMVGQKYAGELELEQAYIDYHGSDEFGFRAGVILAPVGYINETHEPPTFFGVERPAFSKSILPTTWFDNGASVYGILNKSINYNVTLMGGLNGGAISTEDSLPKSGIQKGGIRSGRAKGEKSTLGGYNFNNPTFIVRADYVGIDGLNIGFSFAIANAKRTLIDAKEKFAGHLPGVSTSIVDLHAQYNKDNIFFKAQFATVSLDKGIIGYDGHQGVLVEAGYDLCDSEETLAPFFRFENLNLKNGHDIDATEDESNLTILTFGVNYKPLDQIVFKADYSTQKSAEKDAKSKNTISVGVGYNF